MHDLLNRKVYSLDDQRTITDCIFDKKICIVFTLIIHKGLKVELLNCMICFKLKLKNGFV